MKKLYTIKELAKKYDFTPYTVRMKLKLHGVKCDSVGVGSGCPSLYYLSSVSRVLDKRNKCLGCGVSFSVVHDRDKYCSRTCYQIEFNKRNKKTDRVESFDDNPFADFPSADRSYRVGKGKEERKKIMECSVDCLLDELGDIE